MPESFRAEQKKKGTVGDVKFQLLIAKEPVLQLDGVREVRLLTTVEPGFRGQLKHITKLRSDGTVDTRRNGKWREFWDKSWTEHTRLTWSALCEGVPQFWCA